MRTIELQAYTPEEKIPEPPAHMRYVFVLFREPHEQSFTEGLFNPETTTFSYDHAEEPVSVAEWSYLPTV